MSKLVDLKDRKILYEFDKNSRQTNKQIAKKIGLSEQVTGNRIKRLIDKGIIEYFFVKTNPYALGYMHIKVYLRLHNINKEIEDKLIHDLNKKNEIYWLASLRGKYDLVASLYIKNIADFSDKYEDIFGKCGEYVRERNVIVLERAHTYTKAYLLSSKNSEEIVYSKGKEEKINLDEIDVALLRVLNKGARKSLIDIAEDLNISSDTVSYRIKRLKKTGVITGFGVKIDFNKLNNSYYIILLRLQNMNKEKYTKLEQFSKMERNIIISIKTIGDHDFEFEIETTSKEQFDKLIKSLRDCFVLEMKDYEVLEVTREYRMTYFPF